MKSLYRQMEVFLFYDLEMKTKKDVYEYTQFHKHIDNLGFIMIQNSVYLKHCTNAIHYTKIRTKLESKLPKKGDIRIMAITSKQYKNLEIIRGKKIYQEDKINGERFLVL